MHPTILIAPSGFKEALDPDQVACCIVRGLQKAKANYKLLTAPLVDGGEGTARLLAEWTQGQLIHQLVCGPLGQPVQAHFAMLGGDWTGTAVIEMAQAAGLRLIPANKRNPMITTTRGVGELIRAALDRQAQRIIVGCGDSGTNDAGAGAVQALGVRLLDAHGRDLEPGGAALQKLERIVLDDRDDRLQHTTIEVACNWAITLADVTQKFSAQKGASRQHVPILEASLNHFADIVQRDLGLDLRTQPGSGASGGLAAGLAALVAAHLRPRFEVFFPFSGFDKLLTQADVVITAEGRIDAQTIPGKVPGEVARRAARHNIPVIVLAGSIAADAPRGGEAGIAAYESILSEPCSLAEAMENTPRLLEAAAERLGRTMGVGLSLSQNHKSALASSLSTRAC